MIFEADSFLNDKDVSEAELDFINTIDESGMLLSDLLLEIEVEGLLSDDDLAAEEIDFIKMMDRLDKDLAEQLPQIEEFLASIIIEPMDDIILDFSW